jgi:UDP:flavonoid glycosyltransferase YjiC (YdhE family)
MKRALLACFGTHGDNFPYVALTRALKNKGVEVVAAVSPGFADLFEAEGASVIRVGERLDFPTLFRETPAYMVGAKATTLVLRDFYVPFNLALAEALQGAPHCDVVISHPFCFSSIFLALERDLPSVVVHLAPGSVITTSELLPFIPTVLRVLIRGPIFFGVRRYLDRIINEIRTRTGRESLSKPFVRLTQNPDLSLGLWSPLYRPHARDDAPTFALCGFPPALSQGALDPDLLDFIEGGDPPLIFGLGSSAVHVAGDFHSRAARACKMMQRRGVLVTPNPPDDLPDSIIAVPYAPFDALIPRAAVFVHHGGVGTTAEALRLGTPTVVVPFAHDQPDNAHRAEALGTSTTVTRWASSSKLARAFERSMGMKTRAEEVGQLLRAEPDGAETAAEKILALQ